VDLKPALDGYAGVPQETRLLFAGLRCLSDKFHVEGLLQHGGGPLVCEIDDVDSHFAPAERILRHSRSVISFYGAGKRDLLAQVIREIGKLTQLFRLRWQARTPRPVTLGLFDERLFADFIWSRFFSKTLAAEKKSLVTSANYRILRPARRLMYEVGMSAFPLCGKSRFLAVDTSGYDFLLAQMPFPGRVASGTQLVVRYHDAVPILMPHTISDKGFHQASHFYPLRDNVASGACFVCVSEATRQDLLTLFPEAEPRTAVIHNMVSPDYFVEATERAYALRILRTRWHRDEASPAAASFKPGKALIDAPYLLMVSTLEPRKNHQLLVAAWERLKFTDLPELRLVIVGAPGWDSKPILKSFQPWLDQGDLVHLSNVPSDELRVLYQHAAATICPSVAEGFDYSGVEAMCCGGLVIASDIAVHQEIFQSAAAYFDPYSSEQAAQKIRYLLGKEGAGEANEKRAAAARVAARFSRESLLPQWEAFFDQHVNKSAPNT